MASTKKRIDTSTLFQNMMNAGDTSNIGEESVDKAIGSENKRSGRRKQTLPVEKKVPVTIYLTEKTALELRQQGASKQKAKDKTAIAAAAIELLLDMDASIYEQLRSFAATTGKTTGQVVNEALEKFF